MRHAVPSRDAACELDDRHENDERPRPNGQEAPYVYLAVGKQDGVREENAVPGARGPDDGRVEGEEEAEERAAETADEIVVQKPVAAPHALEGGSEHPDDEHVEDEVPDAPVHEHVRDDLPDVALRNDEARGEPENIDERGLREDHLHHVDDDVDDDDLVDDASGQEVDDRIRRASAIIRHGDRSPVSDDYA